MARPNSAVALCFAGCGTAFSLTPPASPGGSWTPKLLYSFNAGGYAPGMVIASGGVLYGINASGGTAGYGTVFTLTPPASPIGMHARSMSLRPQLCTTTSPEAPNRRRHARTA